MSSSFTVDSWMGKLLHSTQQEFFGANMSWKSDHLWCSRVEADACQKVASFQRKNGWDRVLISLGRRDDRDCLYSPADVDEASRQFNLTCGPAAFAALVSAPLLSVLPLFPQSPDRPWTTPTDMRAAAKRNGTKLRAIGPDKPTFGLALIEFLPLKPRPYTHPCARLKRTHWVTVWRDAIYDINWQGWLPKRIWERIVYPHLISQFGGAAGWQVLEGFEKSG
jgi:hypothetical protein